MQQMPFEWFPVDISNSSLAGPNKKVTAHAVKFQVASGKPVADFEATWMCVGDGAGHPGDLAIAILGVCGHHLRHGYARRQCMVT